MPTTLNRRQLLDLGALVAIRQHTLRRDLMDGGDDPDMADVVASERAELSRLPGLAAMLQQMLREVTE